MNEELKNILADIKTEAVREVRSIVAVFMKNVWDVEDCAIALKVSASRVRHMASDNVLPYYKQNGSLFFKREEIEAWQTAHRTASKDEINAQATTYCATRRLNK